MASAVVPQEVEFSLLIARSTAPTFWADQTDVTGRNRWILYFMKKWGTLVLGENWGTAGVWSLKNKLPETRPFTDRQQVQYASTQPRVNLHANQKLFITTESISYHEELFNKSRNQIVDLNADKNVSLKQSAEANLCARFYDDAADDPNNLDGIETLFNTSTTVAADKVAKPSGTYGGINIALGSRGGSWSSDLSVKPNANVGTDWPQGKASSPFDHSYDDAAPLILNTTSSSWETGATWKLNAGEEFHYMQTYQRNRCGKLIEKGSKPVHLLSADNLFEWKESLRKLGQVFMPIKEGTDFGLPEALEFNGDMVTTDYDVPGGVGYYVIPEFIEFACPAKMLFTPQSFDMTPDFVIPMAVVTAGNFRLQPKCLGAYKPVAA